MVRPTDPAWQHCTSINGKTNHVRCNYCGHTMWGGVARFKGHLANKKGDVMACPSCPSELTAHMKNLLLHGLQNKEDKKKGKRKPLQTRMKRGVDKEKACVEKVFNESIQTNGKEKQQADMDNNNVYEMALCKSLHFYEVEEQMRQGGGSSSGAYNAGMSHANYNDLDYFQNEFGLASDYDTYSL